MLDSVAKLLNTCESDNIDNETIINATSIQVAVSIGNYSLLLTGMLLSQLSRIKFADMMQFNYRITESHNRLKTFLLKKAINFLPYISYPTTQEIRMEDPII